MHFGGSFAHHQEIGYLPTGLPLGNEPRNLAFTLREPIKDCSGGAVGRGRFFPGQAALRGVQEVLAQVAILNRFSQGYDPFSCGGKGALGQVFLLEAPVLSSQRAIDLPEEWYFLSSQGAAPGFL